MCGIEIPLARCADEAIRSLARATGSPAIAQLDGQTLLGERAMLAGLKIPERVAAGRGCRLFDAVDDTIALNLARSADRELLPALFETDSLDATDDRAIAAQVARSSAIPLVARGRSMGLAIAAEGEQRPETIAIRTELVRGAGHAGLVRRTPRVVDLSALWAGPLASHLLWLAGAEVIKVESRTRPDSMRAGDQRFFALLNQGKASVACDFADAEDHRALRLLIASADIVIEASRPRALLQHDIDASEFVLATPGLTWVTITAHGARGEAANWVGFGDDCGVAGGLSAALRSATGRTGFVGDAIADPLTGVFAALAAWEAWASGRGGRIGIAMSHVVADCLARSNNSESDELRSTLCDWGRAAGQPFPPVRTRGIGAVASFGEHTAMHLARHTAC